MLPKMDNFTFVSITIDGDKYTPDVMFRPIDKVKKKKRRSKAV
jgi:hypothetical protein